MSLLNVTLEGTVSHELWSAVKADLPRWIYGAINRMGLPTQARGGGKACGGATRAALLRDEDLQQAIMNEVYLELRGCASRGVLPQDAEAARKWACVVTVRTAQRMATAQARVTAADAMEVAEGRAGSAAENPERISAARQALRLVSDHLAEMGEIDREILMSVMDGESHDDIASRMGLKQETMRSRLFRIRARLRETLAESLEEAEAA